MQTDVEMREKLRLVNRKLIEAAEIIKDIDNPDAVALYNSLSEIKAQAKKYFSVYDIKVFVNRNSKI